MLVVLYAFADTLTFHNPKYRESFPVLSDPYSNNVSGLRRCKLHLNGD